MFYGRETLNRDRSRRRCSYPLSQPLNAHFTLSSLLHLESITLSLSNLFLQFQPNTSPFLSTLSPKPQLQLPTTNLLLLTVTFLTATMNHDSLKLVMYLVLMVFKARFVSSPTPIFLNCDFPRLGEDG